MRAIRRLVKLLLVAALLAGAWLFLPSTDAAADQRALAAGLQQVRALLSAPAQRAEAVSAWSTHEHAEHMLLADEGIVGLIEAGTEPDPVEPLALLGRVVLRTGVIPRGRGDAPATTVPSAADPQQLLARLAALERRCAALDPLALEASEGVVGNHPVFGGLAAAQWLRLAGVHTQHHLKITADIAAASPTAD